MNGKILEKKIDVFVDVVLQAQESFKEDKIEESAKLFEKSTGMLESAYDKLVTFI